MTAGNGNYDDNVYDLNAICIPVRYSITQRMCWRTPASRRLKNGRFWLHGLQTQPR
jgi:hypothetical protein